MSNLTSWEWVILLEAFLVGLILFSYLTPAGRKISLSKLSFKKLFFWLKKLRSGETIEFKGSMTSSGVNLPEMEKRLEEAAREVSIPEVQIGRVRIPDTSEEQRRWMEYMSRGYPFLSSIPQGGYRTWAQRELDQRERELGRRQRELEMRVYTPEQAALAERGLRFNRIVEPSPLELDWPEPILRGWGVTPEEREAYRTMRGWRPPDRSYALDEILRLANKEKETGPWCTWEA